MNAIAMRNVVLGGEGRTGGGVARMLTRNRPLLTQGEIDTLLGRSAGAKRRVRPAPVDTRAAAARLVAADAAWRARDWARAAAELRALLRACGSAQLDAHARQAVLRAAVASMLARDTEGVHALHREFAGAMAGAEEGDAFEALARGMRAYGVAIRDLARAVTRTDLLDLSARRLREAGPAGVSPLQSKRAR